MTREEAINTLGNFKRYISGGGVTDRKANKAIDMAIDALQANTSNKSEWIPVSERLPSKDGDAYLVTDYCPLINHIRTRIAYCYANKDGFWSNTPKGYEVIAWMPLPKPYRERTVKHEID